MKLSISKQAANDLEDIWYYTFQKWSKDQADRYINLILNELNYITKNPNLGKDLSDIREGYFSVKIKSHSIFYKVVEEQNRTEIIRILLQRMDYTSRLN